MMQQPKGHHTWPVTTYCDDCGQPTAILPHHTYALCQDCQPTTEYEQAAP